MVDDLGQFPSLDPNTGKLRVKHTPLAADGASKTDVQRVEDKINLTDVVIWAKTGTPPAAWINAARAADKTPMSLDDLTRNTDKATAGWMAMEGSLTREQTILIISTVLADFPDVSEAAATAAATAAVDAVAAELGASDVILGSDLRVPQRLLDSRFARGWADDNGNIALGIVKKDGAVVVGGTLEVESQKNSVSDTGISDISEFWRVWTDNYGRIQLGLRLDGGVYIAGSSGSSSSRVPEPSWSTKKAYWDPSRSVYNLNPRSLLRWKAAYSKARANKGIAHLSALGDSRTYGAEGLGVTYPKWSNSWPGILRRFFASQTQDSGTGIAPLWDELFTYPNGDLRYARSSGVTSKTTYGTPVVGYGPQGLASATIPTSGWVDFTPTQNVNQFTLYFVADAASTGLATIKIDGVVAGTVSLSTEASGGTLTRKTGYLTNQIVVDVPASNLATHTVRIEGPATGVANLVAVEARTGRSGVRVSNMARSSTRLSEWTLDSGDGRSGLPWHTDLVRSDLQIIMPISNDRSKTPESVKASLAILIQRQRLVGDVLLIAPCMPDFASLGGTADNWQLIVKSMYELSDEYDVPLVDLTWAWIDYSTANGLGLFADGIHENDAGSQMISDLLASLLTGV